MFAEKIPPLHFQILVIFTHNTEGAPRLLGFGLFQFCFVWGLFCLAWDFFVVVVLVFGQHFL